jgi:hypothetical protein
LFNNPDYQINEEDEDFKLRNPSGVAAKKGQGKRDDMDSDDSDDESSVDDKETAGFHRVVPSDDEDESGNDQEDDDEEDESGSDDDDDGFRGAKVRGEEYDQVKALRKKKEQKASATKNSKQKKKKTVLYEAEDLGDTNHVVVHAGLGEQDASNRVKDKLHKLNMPLEKRMMESQEQASVVKVVNKAGSKEITYVPLGARKKREEKKEGDDEPASRSKRQRRGVKELGFRAPFKKH